VQAPTQRIGISIGDPTGIGPEVTLRALAGDPELRHHPFLLLGELALLERFNQQSHLGLELAADRHQSNAWLTVANPCDTPLPANLAPGAAPAARAAVEWIREGARRCLRQELAALVTAPVNKHAIVQSGIPFIGHTELLTEMAGNPRTVMMLLGHDDRGRWLRVALATTHVAIKDVPRLLTRAKVELAIARAAQACRDLGLARARVAVTGLNPHAGEGGEFGDEEVTTIGPAVEALRQKGFDVTGPLSGDTVFHHALHGAYDAVVAMMHDQGLAPLKLAAFDSGVNWTLGLPFIRTSPDHGTAYDIAGRGVASASSMISAIRLAVQLVGSRPGSQRSA
jgi:4-hydroxythreonine-4-phosphate dehydrogenase